MRVVKRSLYWELVPELQDLPIDPYDEDGYCYYCGNGKWKLHMPLCPWADTIQGVTNLMSLQGWFV